MDGGGPKHQLCALWGVRSRKNTIVNQVRSMPRVDGTDRGACSARRHQPPGVASRQLAYTSWLPLSQPPGWAWTKLLNSNYIGMYLVLELRRDFPTCESLVVV